MHDGNGSARLMAVVISHGDLRRARFDFIGDDKIDLRRRGVKELRVQVVDTQCCAAEFARERAVGQALRTRRAEREIDAPRDGDLTARNGLRISGLSAE